MTIDTKELRGLAEAATPGPWQDNPAAYECKVCSGEWNDIDWPRQWAVAHTMYAHDTAFIAAANPQAVIALLDRIRDLEEERDQVRQEYIDLDGWCDATRDALSSAQIKHDESKERLAAMTAARDEACEIAKSALDWDVIANRDWRDEKKRIAELRKVGAP